MGGPTEKGVGVDTFSVCWEGTFTFSSSGYYTFTARADDGIKVYVGEKEIINDWTDHAVRPYTENCYIDAGEHKIKVQYYDNTGLAEIQLNWQPSVAPAPVVIDPQKASSLFSSQSGQGYTLFEKDYLDVFQICPAHESNYSKSNRNTTGPLYVVIHNTGGGTTQSNINHFQTPNIRASAHYLVGRDSSGTIRIIQMVSESHNAWHADANRRTLEGKEINSTNSIGIEIVGHSGNHDWPSDEIYRAVTALVKDIVQRNRAKGRQIELNRSYIVGHEEVNQAGKWDPGPNWNWEQFMKTHLGGIYKPTMQLTATYDASSGLVNLQLEARANGRNGFRIERSEGGGPYEEIKRTSNLARSLSNNPEIIQLSDKPPLPPTATEYRYRIWAYIDGSQMFDGTSADYVNSSNEALVILPH